jgi:hypothetical protein
MAETMKQRSSTAEKVKKKKQRVFGSQEGPRFMNPSDGDHIIRYLYAVPKLNYIPGRDLNLEEKQLLNQMVRDKKN